MSLDKPRWQRVWLILSIILGGFFIYLIYSFFGSRPGGWQRTARVMSWLREPDHSAGWAIVGGQRCGEAPFLLPTSGLVGFLWDDSFRIGHRHQGIDIFGGQAVGQTPVFAAYSGFLSRQTDWKSSVIMRIPQDPLQPARQIWIYYTHMADEAGNSLISSQFPPGVHEVYVEAGTLLGYQGNYSGQPGNPVGVHLHFSLVQDDGKGKYLNELKIQNTLDPSPYLGLGVNARKSDGRIVICSPEE